MHEFAEVQKIFRHHVNDATTGGAIDIRDEEKCYCSNQWQHKEHAALLQVAGGNTRAARRPGPDPW